MKFKRRESFKGGALQDSVQIYALNATGREAQVICQRGTTTSSWSDFGSRVSDRALGYAGIGTVTGLGDPANGLAMMFRTTDEPKKDKDVVAIRKGVTDRVAVALR